MTLDFASFRARWLARRDELHRLRATVDAAALIDDILGEVNELCESESAAPVTLAEASKLGGYSIDHLQRLVSHATLPNVGKKGAPRIPRSAVPIKAGHASGSLPLPASDDQVSARRRIVADAQARKGA